MMLLHRIILATISTLTPLLVIASCIKPNFPVQQPPQQPTQQPASTQKTDVKITLGTPTNSIIRPLLGVNIGPIPSGTDPRNADLTAAYKNIGVNMIRTHDYYMALDMSVMYPDRNRDPARPQSYDFAYSDKTWNAITNGGFEPYFRLGDSWNNATPPANAHERINWVRAAIEVLRHYRAGKWGGFNTNFRYVEIWNEPDNQHFWQRPHTPLEYFQLYAETASAIKREFPEIKVGGPGITPAGALTPQGKKWTQDFVDFVRQKNAPLDFFSWHMYSNEPRQYAEAASLYRAILDARGFTQTKTHITEWNTEIKHNGKNTPEALALRAGSKGAAILTAAWIELQQRDDIEVSTFYRGPDPDVRVPTFYGLFYADGRPKRIALAFSLWSKMATYPKRITVSNSISTPLRVLAGQSNDGKTAILIANPVDNKLTAGIAFADLRNISEILLYKVTPTSDKIETSSLSTPIFEIAGDSVYFLIIN